jgi:hypothetical protein
MVLTARGAGQRLSACTGEVASARTAPT